MQNWTRRLLAALLCALLALALPLTTACAEDWRDQLRSAFGLSADYEIEAESTTKPKATKAPSGGQTSGKKSKAPAKASEPQWTYPITDPQQIVNYLDRYGALPDNFITKKEARALGWDSAYNYVGDVAPGKSIGGDRFGNYEGQLPSAKGRTWYECDTGYKGKKRGATRLLYSSDGLYYYTDDHYNTFTQMFPED